MHFSFLSIIICAFLGFFCTLFRILATIGPAGGFFKYDYANPRTAGEVKMDPARKALIGRLNGAQANTWESLPLLIGGVLAAHMSGFPAADLDFLCQIYTGLRIVFVVAYVSGNTALSFLRTISFSVNFFMMIYLFFYAATNYKPTALWKPTA